ncbi:hypothetical protein BDV33DRAFT_181551 [Aspergillus novoparasiticus]|uniref:Uncharacterized protein n=1 Tax=Aspergillus novoparasiticus TaxID=986946 RepID=A0A5N6ED92_9EURO|nr:hypothetical protein BDV33DRAFT_181551 [Aspergillus novoparasiticus]
MQSSLKYKPLVVRTSIINTIGDVTSFGGMTYEARFRHPARASDTFHHEQELGYIAASSYPQLKALLQSCQTPPRQKAFNIRRNATEPFKTESPLTFYTAEELANFQFPRLKKCEWWVEEQALQAIQRSRLLVPKPPAK